MLATRQIGVSITRASRRLPLARLLIVATVPLMLASCQTLMGITADETLSPSENPVTVDNIRSGRLARIGAAQHPKIVATYGGEYSNAKLERSVAAIVGRLVTVSDNPSQVYQITILDTPVVNAFALPGGYLYVSRGLLALANDSAELAAVIAHEMAHVTANHGVLRQRKEAEAELAGRVVSEVLSDRAAGQLALARGKLALAQFSRNQELEADAIGIAVLGEAEFDPYAAAGFQKTMATYNRLLSETGDDASLDFLSTHPSTPQRITLALGHARKFGPPGNGSRDRETYLSGIDGMLFGDSPEEGFVRGRVYAHKTLGIRFAFPAGFDIENRPEAILGARASDGAAVRFDGADVPASQSLTQYLASGWVEGIDLASIAPATINGLDAATGRATVDQWTFDITVIRVDGSVYRLLTAIPSNAGNVETIAGPLRQSFRALTPTEKANLRPLKLRVVKAAQTDTARSLAQQMKGMPRTAEFFRAFNGLEPGAEPQQGRLYKLITD